MLKKLPLFLIEAFFISSLCYAYNIIETEDFVFSIDSYLRQGLVNFKNVVDLDSKNRDDTTTYLGIEYSLGFSLKSKEDRGMFYLKLERNGPFDYDFPLFVHNTLINSAGQIERYRNEQFLPQLE